MLVQYVQKLLIAIRNSLENDAKLIMTIERDIVVILDPFKVVLLIT